jgi:hypothetical protein
MLFSPTAWKQQRCIVAMGELVNSPYNVFSYRSLVYVYSRSKSVRQSPVYGPIWFKIKQKQISDMIDFTAVKGEVLERSGKKLLPSILPYFSKKLSTAP